MDFYTFPHSLAEYNDEYNDADISHIEIFLMLVFIRVPDAYIVETRNATENDGIRITMFPHFSFFL